MISKNDQAMQYYGITFEYELRDRQKEAIPYIENGKDFISVLPTGYGKTSIELMSIGKALLNGKRAVSVVPMKSLSKEKSETLKKYFPTKKIILDDGDHKVKREEYKSWDIAVMTNERYDSFLRDTKKRIILENLGVVVFDEIHMLGDYGRGYRLESAIIKTKILYPRTQMVGSSATIDNAEEFAEKLDFKLVKAEKNERPVKLQAKIVTHEKQWGAIDKLYKKADIIKNLIKKHKGLKFLVFTTSRARTYQIAKIIAGLRLDTKISLEDLCDMYKIGYHNAGLSKKDKHKVEEEFLHGMLNVVISTPTLAYGVNLPADVVVLADMYQFKYTTGEEIIKKDRLEQTMGRAGRPQFSKVGYAYFLCDYEQESEVRSHIAKQFNIESQLKDKMNEIVLEWIVSGIIKDMIDALTVLDYFYDDTITDVDLVEAIYYLRDHDFIYFNKDGIIKHTHKGRMTAYHFIKPESVVYWEEMINKIGSGDMSIEMLFSIIASVEEYASIVTIYNYDTTIISCAKQCLDGHELNILRDEISDLYYENVFKIFGYTFKNAILRKFKKGKDFIKMSKSDQYLIKTSAERYVSAFKVILNVYPKKLDKLLVACSNGILDANALELVELKGIGEKKLNKLLNNNVKSLDDFINYDNSLLSKLIGINEKKLNEIKFDIITRKK